MQLGKSRFASLIGLCFCLLLMPQTGSAATIENVKVSVIDSTGRTAKALTERMTSSMQVVAEQLFLEKDTAQIEPVKSDYARLLGEVGERALTGYKVEETVINLGTSSEIVLKLSPWLDVVNDVEVDLKFSGVDQAMSEVLLSKLPELKARIIKTVSGASIDAVDWAGGVLRQKVRQDMESMLPEFRASVDLSQIGKKVVVQVIVYPVGQTVHDVKFELLSETVPNILFMKTKERLHEEADELRGLPVDFVKKHRPELENRLLTSVNEEKVVSLYSLKPTVTITPGTDTFVEIRMEADKYKIWIEGYGDSGRDENNLSGRAHLGKYISDNDELFAEFSVELENMEWEFAPGLAHRHGKTTIAYARRITEHENNYRLEYDVSPKWRFRAEHFSGTNVNEFGARFRIHEFLSVEYVYSNDKPYLRLIGNL
ncbi:MAG: hypothetical protein GX451_12305 [Acholeplasmataceae bacterium]|nr:hypothetical protein [Acholeplasmataceae bacterium]